MCNAELFDKLGLTSLAKKERGEDVKLPWNFDAAIAETIKERYDSIYMPFTYSSSRSCLTDHCIPLVPVPKKRKLKKKKKNV